MTNDHMIDKTLGVMTHNFPLIFNNNNNYDVNKKQYNIFVLSI